MNPTGRRTHRLPQLLRTAALLLGSWLLAMPAHAQAPTGTILGDVQDAQGGAWCPGPRSPPPTWARSTLEHHDRPCRAVRPPPAARGKLHARRHPGRLQDVLPDRHPSRGRRNARIDADDRDGRASARSSRSSADAPSSRPARPRSRGRVGQNEVLNLPLVNRDLYSLLSITGGRLEQRALELPGRHRSSSPRSTAPAAPRWARVNFQLDGGQQHRGPARHREPGAQSRSRAGVPGPHQRLLGGVRPLLGRRRRCRHQVRDQPVPRRRASSSSATRS